MRLDSPDFLHQVHKSRYNIQTHPRQLYVIFNSLNFSMVLHYKRILKRYVYESAHMDSLEYRSFVSKFRHCGTHLGPLVISFQCTCFRETVQAHRIEVHSQSY